MTGTREVEALCGVLDERDLGMAEWRAMQMRIARTLRALVAERDELRAPALCNVCCGRPLPSGRPCICGDTVRTEQAELHGLRVRCFELEDEVKALTAQLAAARDELRRLRVTVEMYDQVMTMERPAIARDHETRVGSVSLERLRDVLEERQSLRSQLAAARADTERLDSGCILLDGRDPWDVTKSMAHRWMNVDLRAAIDAAKGGGA